MVLNSLHSKCKHLAIIWIIAIAMSSPTYAQPEDNDVLRFFTAALSLPTQIASINHPDSRWWDFSTHALKAINEAASIGDWDNQDDCIKFAAVWLGYDLISMITSLVKDRKKTTSPTSESNVLDDETTSNKEFVKATRYLLASLEAILRATAAIYNEPPRYPHWDPFGPQIPKELPNATQLNEAFFDIECRANYAYSKAATWSTQELLYRCVSLIRTIDLYLCREPGVGKKFLFLLVLANMGAIYRQHCRVRRHTWYHGNIEGAKDGCIATLSGVVVGAKQATAEIQRQQPSKAQMASPAAS